ncbi:MAG: histidinol dehydrogenase [Alicyclobacillus sp.]|nr:histidinol dehydrogenase [Alicyclobacillus sp.]
MFSINKLYWNTETAETRDRILARAGTDIAEQLAVVKPIIDAVRDRGDAALVEFTEKFDSVHLEQSRIKVTEDEFSAAEAQLSEEVKEVLQYAAGNIRKFHEAQKPEPMWLMEVDKGIMAGEKTTPIPDVALYVPRGKGSFPSVLLMLGTPAVVAGVPRIIVLTPPNEQGNVDPAILYCAKLLGITDIYKTGGAQAIAAVAYGTETVPKCAKVIGPGNAYVTAAKRLLMGVIDPGVPAGPSESIILADEFADPYKVALDLLIEAEHGPDSAALVVTHSEQLAREVELELYRLVETIQSSTRKSFVQTVLSRYGGLIITDSLRDSIDFVNQYAPEHMEVMVRDPFSILPELHNAGEILLGDSTPITLCNFLLGPNAILPTGRHARTVSAVSIHDFMKRSSIGYVTPAGLDKVKNMAALFADIEGFETHAKALRER